LYTSVGLARFDGQGHVVEQTTTSTSGVYGTLTETLGYTLAADCTGIMTNANGDPIALLTMVHGNDEVLGVSIVPGSNVAVHFERMPSACTNATLNGVYGFQRNGQSNGASLLALGTVTFDGQGNAHGQQTIIRNGVEGSMVNITGFTYRVNADCTGTQFDSTGAVFSPLIVVHGGDEALAMSLAPANNVVVHFERTH
jgi:hypothetical protein